MKRIIALVLSLMLLGGIVLAEGIDWANMTDEEISAIVEAGQAELKSRSQETTSESTYSYSDVELTITGYENGEIDGQKVLKVLFDWKNIGDKPTSVSMSGLIMSAYQNGKEVESVYDSENGRSDDYMPGYGGAAYYAFENLDDTEITVFMSDLYDLNLDDVVFTVNPADIG